MGMEEERKRQIYCVHHDVIHANYIIYRRVIVMMHVESSLVPEAYVNSDISFTKSSAGYTFIAKPKGALFLSRSTVLNLITVISKSYLACITHEPGYGLLTNSV